MNPSRTYRQISKADFDHIQGQYGATLSSKLKTLDQKRLHDIPDSLTQRKKAGDAYLDKGEVLTLVDWKL